MASVFQQICDALTTAHAVQVVHRDIKPANVFLLATHDGLFVKLLDFGIAKHLDHGGLGMTRPDALLGTPAYMSPEQLLDPQSIDHRAALWSAAAVAYECLLARPPFAGQSILALQEAIAQGAMTPPRALRPGTSGPSYHQLSMTGSPKRSRGASMPGSSRLGSWPRPS